MMFSKFFGKKMFSYSSKQIMEMEYNLGCHNYAPWPVVASKGERVYVWDVEGKKYYDLIAGIGSCNQGHVHPKIFKQFVHQASMLTNISRVFYNDQLALLHKKLKDLFGYDKSILMNGGVESGETAVKMARRWAYNVKKVPDNQAEVIFAKGNFWGRTIAACGSSDDPYRYKNFGPFQGLKFKLIDYNNLQALQNALKANKNVAAFMVEPIQGEKGVIIPTQGIYFLISINLGYLKGASQLCKKYNVLLICDQVQTGLGRTGKMFGFQHEGIRPDLVCLGKSFSGGFMPIAGVLGDNHIFDQINPGEHGSTYGGNPLAARTVMASLDVIIEEKLVENSQKMGNLFMQNFNKIFDQKGKNGKYVKEVRGKGLFIAIEFQGDNMADKIARKLLQKGVILKPTHKHILKLTPALVINQEQVKDICSKFQQAWKQIPEQ